MKEINIITKTKEIKPDELLDDRSCKNGCNLMIDGKILLPEWQSSIEHTRNGLFIIYKSSISYFEGGYRLINDKGKDLIQYACNSIQLVDSGAIYEKDKNGFNRVERFEIKKMIFRVRRSSDNKENFVKPDGTCIYPHWFDRYYTDRPFPVSGNHIKVRDDGMINYIDNKTGELVSKVFFEDREYPGKMSWWQNKEKYGEKFVANVKHNGRWKVLLSNGEII